MTRRKDSRPGSDDDLRLGDFEQIVLFALVRLKNEAHGAAIGEEIEAKTGRRAAPGAVYTALDRMEMKGLVESWIGETVPERGGRRRKVYRLLPLGARALQRSYDALRSMASGVAPRLEALARGRKA
jgi:DNA-binding PadR family transcriptional regulator